MVTLQNASYRINSKIGAIAEDSGGRCLTTLVPGIVVKVICEPNDLGLLRVRCEAREYSVFWEDLNSFGSLIQSG